MFNSTTNPESLLNEDTSYADQTTDTTTPDTLQETQHFQWDNKSYVCVNSNSTSDGTPKALRKAIRKSKINSTVNQLKIVSDDIECSDDYIYVRKYKKQCFTSLSFYGSEQNAWVNPWVCSSQPYENEITQIKKVSQIVTGCCLFGDHLIAIDDEGAHHSFNDISPEETADQAIQDVFQQGDIHAYELMNHSQLRLLVPLMQAISEATPLIHFHLPVDEYLLKGVVLYQCGKLSIDTLVCYSQLVIERGYRHKRILIYSYNSDHIQVKTGSTMSVLGLTDIVNKSSSELKVFLEDFSLEYVVSALSSMTCWKNYFSQYPPENLMSILNISYTMFVAFHSPVAFETAVIDSNTERKICDGYKKIEPALPAVLALHWIPKVMPSKLNSWYYAADNEKSLQSMVRSGLFKKASLQKNIQCYNPEQQNGFDAA